MFKKLSLILFPITFGFLQANAQCCGSNQLMIQQITASPFVMYSQQYDSVPFLSTKWSKASLKVKSGEVYHELNVKIDIFKDDLIYYNEALHKQLIVDKEIIEEISLENEAGEQAYLIKNVCNNDSLKKKKCSFYFIHLNDSISVWSSRKKDIAKYNTASTNMLGYYYTQVKYFMVINKQLINLPQQKRALAKMFPTNQRDILSYIKKNHLKLKNPSHLVRLFEKINELEKASKAI